VSQRRKCHRDVSVIPNVPSMYPYLLDLSVDVNTCQDMCRRLQTDPTSTLQRNTRGHPSKTDFMYNPPPLSNMVRLEDTPSPHPKTSEPYRLKNVRNAKYIAIWTLVNRGRGVSDSDTDSETPHLFSFLEGPVCRPFPPPHSRSSSFG